MTLIHRHVAANLGAEVLLDLENHHDFAWKERHLINGVEKEVVVRRKGLTPAGQGVLGIIPARCNGCALAEPAKKPGKRD